MKIGLVGIGFVGGALLKSFSLKSITVEAYDKFKQIGTFEKILESDVLFLCLPTQYDFDSQSYDLQPIHETCSALNKNNYKGLIVIKSTVEPTTCETIAEKYQLKVMHNPEFLTARTAFEDFHTQTHIVLGKTKNCSDKDVEILASFYKMNYPGATITNCTSTVSETVKIACNCFYAVKVQFFNELYLLCKTLGIDYNEVKDTMLKNQWINPMHTTVPGPDGSLSYGGYCFPKDTNALNNFMKRLGTPNGVLEATITERDQMRSDHVNCKSDAQKA